MKFFVFILVLFSHCGIYAKIIPYKDNLDDIINSYKGQNIAFIVNSKKMVVTIVNLDKNKKYNIRLKPLSNKINKDINITKKQKPNIKHLRVEPVTGRKIIYDMEEEIIDLD